MFYLTPLVFIDATDIQSTSPKGHDESYYALMGYLHFFVIFPSASADGISELIYQLNYSDNAKQKGEPIPL